MGGQDWHTVIFTENAIVNKSKEAKQRDSVARVISIASLVVALSGTVVSFFNYRYYRAVTEDQRAVEVIDLLSSAIDLIGGDSGITAIQVREIETAAEKRLLERAKRDIDKALSLSPKLPGAHAHLGIYWLKMGDQEKALAAFEKAVSLDPEFARGYLGMAAASQVLDDLVEAEENYRLAIKYDPELAPAYSNLGAILRSNGQLEEAIAQYEKAVALDQTFAPAYFNLALALQSTGRNDEAISNFRKAINADSNFQPATYNLAKLLVEAGRSEEALQVLQPALQAEPENVDLLRLLRIAERSAE